MLSPVMVIVPASGALTVTLTVFVSVAVQVTSLTVCVAVTTTVYSPPWSAEMLFMVMFCRSELYSPGPLQL